MAVYIYRWADASSQPSAGGSREALGYAVRDLRREFSSTNDCGLLLGTSGQTIYKWEEGKVRPRTQYLPAIAAPRTMGKKQAAARLSELRVPAAN